MDTEISTRFHENLNNAFKAINEKWYNGELEMPMILVQTTGKMACYGYCTTRKVWYKENDSSMYEIAISSEYLNRGFIPTITTLMHECVHLYNLQHNIRDCSGRYHTKVFKNEAEKRGLHIEKAYQIGFSVTTLNEEGKAWAETLENDEELYSYYRNTDGAYRPTVTTNSNDDDSETSDNTDKEKTKKVQKNFTYTCPHCNEKIVSKNPNLNIICGECGCKFERKHKENEN